jgi:hypothetical protein
MVLLNLGYIRFSLGIPGQNTTWVLSLGEDVILPRQLYDVRVPSLVISLDNWYQVISV